MHDPGKQDAPDPAAAPPDTETEMVSPMRPRRFIQCDVFTSVPTKGNGLAVVADGEGLSDTQMQAFAAWTNLAETTFLLPPTNGEADYRLRIFTPGREMPFAGHPTLGSCAAWRHLGGKSRTPGVVRQECGVGIVDIDVSGAVTAFAAPKTTVAQLAPEKRDAITSALGLASDRIVRTAQLANGPVWQVLELKSAADVLAVDSSRIRYPEFVSVGLIGAHPPGSECQFETRMLAPSSGMSEDPITGSLNAAIAQWMYGAGHWRGPITVAQGTRIGREGRVFIRRDDKTGIGWIGGETRILIEGTLTL
jgi:PhzF family phenazine biosynthesis protein